jgi:uncharacterized protein (DUF1919 family)
MKMNLNFGQALEALSSGKRVTKNNWDKLFIFMQIPAEISYDVIPKMQSLPQSVKDEFHKRGSNINYSNQLVIVNQNNNISSWSPSVSDCLSQDWITLD